MKSIEADTSLPAARVTRVLERLVAFRGTPQSIRVTMVLSSSVTDSMAGMKEGPYAYISSNLANPCKTPSLIVKMDPLERSFWTPNCFTVFMMFGFRLKRGDLNITTNDLMNHLETHPNQIPKSHIP